MRNANPEPSSPQHPSALRPGSHGYGGLDDGFKAFKKEKFTEAIQAWGSLSPDSLPQLKPALAEAHFRRALGQADRSAAIPDLRDALGLVPEDGRFWYHLGLALHQNGELKGAREAYALAARHGFPRREPLAYVQGLLELEAAHGEVAPGMARALPGLCLEEDLIAPVRALLMRDWTTLAALAPFPAVPHAKGTPAVPGMVGLLRGLGQVGLGQWAQGLQTLGSLAPDLLPGPLEALRVVFLGRALERTGRGADARKIRAATLARTQNATLGAEVAEASLAEMEALLAERRWTPVVPAARELLKHFPCARARGVAAIALDQLGREAFAEGRWGEAANHWRELLRLGGEDLPGKAACAHNLALAWECQEQWDQAASAWEAALAAMPKRITKTRVKAGTAFGGLSPEALIQRREWIERRALELRQRTGMTDDVLRQRKALIKRNPKDLDLRLEQVAMLLDEGEIRAADREISAILRIDPEHLGALEASARVLLMRGLAKPAETVLRRVLAIEPGRAFARRALAQVLAARAVNLPGAADQTAVAMLEEAIELSPKEGRFRLLLADRLLNGHAAEQAQAQLEAALALGPEAWREVFGFWVNRRDLAQLKALVTRGEALGVLDPEFYIDGGLDCLRVAEESGRVAKAQAWAAFCRVLLDQAAAHGPSLDQLRDLVSYLLVPHPELALPYAERAAELGPTHPMVLMDLAVAQSGTGQVEAAKATLLKVERVARTHKDRREAASILGLLRVIPALGVHSLHATFCRVMEELEEDFDSESEGDS